MLGPYPRSVVWIKHLGGDALGEFLPCIGQVYRPFKEKHPNYYDGVVHDFIVGHGESVSDYSKYAVVPRVLAHSHVALRRFDKNPYPLSSEILSLYEKVSHWLDLEFSVLSDSDVASFDEVREWLPSDTSPGYPWTLAYPTKGDYWLSEHSYFSGHYWDKLSTDDYIRSFCSVTIKEELRPVEKIAKGGVRTICAMDVNHVESHLRLCLRQNQWLVGTVAQHSSYLGYNIFQGGFHRLNQRMSCFGKSTVALDGVQFDARFLIEIFQLIAKFRFRMLRRLDRTHDNWLRMRNLYRQLAVSYLVNVDGNVYVKYIGGPSGHGCTTPDNTIKNYMDRAVDFLISVPLEYQTYDKFSRFVRMCICGDNINQSIHPELHEFINPVTIKRNAPLFGMEYHIEHDSFQENCDCEFLGHRFVYVETPFGGMYLPNPPCNKMRTSMLIYNEAHELYMTIIRACALRNETFACLPCRGWFEDLIAYLRVRSAGSTDVRVVAAWKNYLPDRALWMLYTGLDSAIVHTA